MKIVTYLNTTFEEVEASRKNIWFGISLGNKKFARENLEIFIPWIISHSKEHAIVVIADAIHAINIEVLDRKSKTSSETLAKRKGIEKEEEIKEIIARLSSEEQSKITIIHWKDVEEVEEKKAMYKIFKEEFTNSQEFKEYIISIIKGHPKVSKMNCTGEDYNKLAEYILRELPIYINGAYCNGIRYLLQPYPGLSKLDDLIIGLQGGTLFPELSKKLGIKNKISILEAYGE